MFINHYFVKLLSFLTTVNFIYCGGNKNKGKGIKNKLKNNNGSILKGKRLSNYGNFGNIKYNIEKPIKKLTQEEKKIAYECSDIFDIIVNNSDLQMALRGYLLIAGVPKFTVGTAENNIFEGRKTHIDNFLLKNSKVTRDEYFSFLETISEFLQIKDSKKNFYVSEADIKNNLFIKKDSKISTKDKKKLEKQVEARRESEEFEHFLNDYLDFRRNLIENLDKDYIKNMLPRFLDFNDFPYKNSDYMRKYAFEEKYGDYPITCVSYLHYVEFCKWQTFCINEFLLESLISFVKEKKIKAENIPVEKKILVIVYPVSYAEYTYACCCGNSKWLYSCGNFNITDDDGNYKFNFNSGQSSNSDVNITSVYKYPKNKYGLYDCTGNTSVWFRTNETEYIYDNDDNKNNNGKDWRYGAFSRLIDEGAKQYNVDYNKIDITKRVKMVSRGTCNSTLSDVQNGKYDNCHIFEASPFLGFTTAAKVITVSKKKNII